LYCSNANGHKILVYLLLDYSGDYGESVTLETLEDLYRSSVNIFAEAGANILASETTSNKLEAQVNYCKKLKNLGNSQHFEIYEAPVIMFVIDKCKLEFPISLSK
jgi:methionine synthase I (cobalamin-dependent)